MSNMLLLLSHVKSLPRTSFFIRWSQFTSVGINLGSFRRSNLVQANFAIKFGSANSNVVGIELFGTRYTLETSLVKTSTTCKKKKPLVLCRFEIFCSANQAKFRKQEEICRRYVIIFFLHKVLGVDSWYFQVDQGKNLVKAYFWHQNYSTCRKSFSVIHNFFTIRTNFRLHYETLKK